MTPRAMNDSDVREVNQAIDEWNDLASDESATFDQLCDGFKKLERHLQRYQNDHARK